jgi:hypothetical protein
MWCSQQSMKILQEHQVDIVLPPHLKLIYLPTLQIMLVPIDEGSAILPYRMNQLIELAIPTYTFMLKGFIRNCNSCICYINYFIGLDSRLMLFTKHDFFFKSHSLRMHSQSSLHIFKNSISQLFVMKYLPTILHAFILKGCG